MYYISYRTFQIISSEIKFCDATHFESDTISGLVLKSNIFDIDKVRESWVVSNDVVKVYHNYGSGRTVIPFSPRI